MHIVQKDFNLHDRTDAVRFLQTMHNIVVEFDSILNILDDSKRKSLQSIKDSAKGLTSLTAAAKGENAARAKKGTSGGNLEAITDTEKGAFDTHEVCAYLEAQQYNKMVLWKVCLATNAAQISLSLTVLDQHPHVAVISHQITSEHGFLKFVPCSKAKEVAILQLLSGIDSYDNHTVRPLDFWAVNGGTMVSMPMVGCPCNNYAKLATNLQFVVQQLVEAVAFMHKHNVAHLDLKPSNILVDRTCGQLWIIDFGISTQVKNIDEMCAGFVGTKGYTAPEVGRESYSPIRADLWSCGNVIRELCQLCKPSRQRNALLEASRELMNEDPLKRPEMSRMSNRLASIFTERPINKAWLR